MKLDEDFWKWLDGWQKRHGGDPVRPEPTCDRQGREDLGRHYLAAGKRAKYRREAEMRGEG